MLEIEYKGRLIKATVYSVEHRLKINSENYNNENQNFSYVLNDCKNIILKNRSLLKRDFDIYMKIS